MPDAGRRPERLVFDFEILPLPEFDCETLEFDDSFLLLADEDAAAVMRLELGVPRDADFRELSLRPFLPEADERDAERAE